jgi:hypothetical protein
MSQCRKCLNCVPDLSVCGKKMKDWLWPQDYGCLMKMNDFPEATECKWSMEFNAGEATFLQEEPGGIRREK